MVREEGLISFHDMKYFDEKAAEQILYENGILVSENSLPSIIGGAFIEFKSIDI